ncbi:DUF924 domain-containing protein [Candidatus Puniceispirillum sp.]|nr:DUF924 domain-containing protein [Candidatus Puniceispirillum sp.]
MLKTPKSQDILNFWFAEISPDSWFRKDSNFDNELEKRFGKAVSNALSGRLDHWADNVDGCLALIILLDQFTRNIFRQSARAFSGDEMALALSLRCVDRGYLDVVGEPSCHFMLMPMMHSEVSKIQKAALPLFKKYTSDLTYDFAVKHHDAIIKFGRFPHRNKALGRPNTLEENKCFTQPCFSF